MNKSLYGLKQAPRQWYWKFESFMTDQGYHKTQADHCAFVKKHDGRFFLVLLLNVDDVSIVGKDLKKIIILKKALSRSFAKDMGPTKQIRGMHIVWVRTKRLLWLSQEKYVVVKIFVHGWKPERNEQTRDVQRCTFTCCICILLIVTSVKCMVLEMHHSIRKV